jgi:hypothetical protein
MWSCHGNRHLVVGEDEAALGPRVDVCAMDDSGGLVRHLVHAEGRLQGVHDIGESPALIVIQIRRNRGVEDDHRGALRCVGEQPRKVDE